MREVENRSEQHESGRPSESGLNALQLLQDGRESTQRAPGGAEPNQLEFSDPFKQDGENSGPKDGGAPSQGENTGPNQGLPSDEANPSSGEDHKQPIEDKNISRDDSSQ